MGPKLLDLVELFPDPLVVEKTMAPGGVISMAGERAWKRLHRMPRHSCDPDAI